MPNVNLDELIDADLSITLDGKQWSVLPADAVVYSLLAETTKGDVQAAYKAAITCLPDVPAERVKKLSVTQVNAVLELACEGIGKVEALASPNSAPAGARKKRRG